MPMIKVQSFGGIAPVIPARFLKDTMAQTAVNCEVFNGSLKSLPDVGPTVHTLAKTGTTKTIYRYGQDLVSDTQYWFHWLTDVDVCRGQIAGDTSEWTFYTGDGPPKATYAAIATAGNNHPAAYRRLGIPNPDASCVAIANGSPDASDTPETRVYTYTWVAKEAGYDMESGPAPASLPVDCTADQTVTISDFEPTPQSGYNITHKRIYRSVGGLFLFLAEISAAADSYVDDADPDALGEILPSLYWNQPPDDLAGLTNMPNGMMAGFVSRDVYFCEPYRPHAWPQNYVQTVDYPVVGLGRMDTTLAVLTTGVPYLMQGSSPDSVAVVKSDLEQACVSKRSIVSFGSAVLYAAPDGLMMLSSNGSKIITEKLFDFRLWQSFFKPESIHAYAHDNKYIAFYDNDGTRGGFIFDVASGEFTLHDMWCECGYQDMQRDKLFLGHANRTLKVWQDGDNQDYTWKSKKFTMPQIMGFSCAQLESEAYPMVVKIIADDAVIHTQTVQSRDPFRLPAVVGRDWELQIEGREEVFSLAMATSMTELASV